MPDTKITALPTLTSSTIAADDRIPVVDRSDTTDAASGTTKQITKAQLAAAVAADPAVTSQYARLLNNTSKAINPHVVMASAPTVGSLASATAISSPQYVRTGGQATGAGINVGWFTTLVGSAWSLAGASFPDNNLVRQLSPTTAGGSTVGVFEFMFDGTALEIIAKSNNANVLIYVDGELISATPTSLANDGAIKFLPVSFGSRGTRRIRIEANSILFGGVVIGATDSVWPTGENRPNVLVIGDSFTEGTGATYGVDGYVPRLGHHLGWSCWGAGQGGSGYGVAGSYTGKFSTRLGFYSGVSFDAVIVAGGINDTTNTTTAGAVATEAPALFAAIRAAWPNAKLYATSPLIQKGVEGWPATYYTVRDSIRTAVAAAGGTFVDLMEMPAGPALTGTLASAALASATSISSSIIVPVGSTLEIGTGTANRERRRITSVSGGGPFTLGVAALTNAHSSGETVTQVGASLWTGTGRVGTTTGLGNCDIYVASDGTHPSSAGHAAIARAMAERILATL